MKHSGFLIGFLSCLTAPAMAQFGSPPLPLPNTYQLSDDAFNQIGQVGYCIELGGSNSCTANDFSITSITINNVDNACISPDDYMQVDMDVTYSKTQPTRYDVAAWFYRGAVAGNDFNAQDAIIGDFCIRNEIGAGLITNGDITRNVDGDACIDAPGSAGPIQAETLNDFILPCRDVVNTLGAAVPDGTVDISACTSWNNNQSGRCDTVVYQEFDLNWPNSPNTTPGTIEAVPNTGSKCGCDEFDGGPLIVQIPDPIVSKSCPTVTPPSPGDAVTCTITITNSGLGLLDGATALGTEGFFYVDDYPESQGAIDGSSIVITSVGNTTVADAFTVDETGAETSNQSLNIYPDDIAPGGVVTVVYDFIIDSSLDPNEEVTITNTVCTSYYDVAGNEVPPSVEVYNYDTFDNQQCASDDIVTTPVSLGHVSIKAVSGNQLAVEFSTATETGNLGFNIYAIAGRSKFRLNDRLIPSRVIDSMTHTTYSVTLDTDLIGVADRFLIEDVDRYGHKSVHGTFAYGQTSGVRHERKTAEARTDWDAIGQSHQLLSDQRQADRIARQDQAVLKRVDAASGSLVDGLSTAQQLALTIRDDGVYRVTFEELLAMGMDLSGRSADALSLTDRGQAIPIHVLATGKRNTFAAGSEVHFIGRAAKSLYADHAVYVLSMGQGIGTLMPEMNAGPRGNRDVTTQQKTLRVARDRLYSFASPVDGEPWFDTQIFAYNIPAVERLDLELAGIDSQFGEGTLRVNYWGGTDFPDDDQEHKVRFSLNGVLLGTDVFDGVTERSRSFVVTGLGTSNQLDIELPADNVNGIDLVSIESVELQYQAQLMAHDGLAHFDGTGQTHLIEGFGSDQVHAYAVAADGVYRLEKARVDHSGQSHVVRLSTQADAEYLVVEQAAMIRPQMRWLSSGSLDALSAPHLIIAHPDFINDDLYSYANQTRGAVDVVNVEDIYRQYSGANRDAEAIRSFLNAAAAGHQLESILLVGGDSYDYHDNLGLGVISFVPTLYRATDALIRYSAVDSLYGDLDGDLVPDVAVGRLPVRTPAELAIVLEKSLRFEALQGDHSAILTADNQEAFNAYDFSQSSDAIATLLNDQDWAVQVAYLDEMPVAQARQTLLDELNRGVRLAVYTGHSSSRRWSYDGLLQQSDLAQLTNATQPFGVVQWGCWNTYFVEPTEDSLGHGFMLSGEAGAALVVGASTLTDAHQESIFSQIMHQQMLIPGMSIGQAMTEAKRLYAAQAGKHQLDILLGISLLGDPVLQIQ